MNTSTRQRYLLFHQQPFDAAEPSGPVGILSYQLCGCLRLLLRSALGKAAGPASWPSPLLVLLPCLPELNDSPQVRKYKSMILEDLESALAEHAPAPQEVNSELPPLTIDGIPVSVDKMTQVSSQSWQNQRELASCRHILLLCSRAYVYISRGCV